MCAFLNRPPSSQKNERWRIQWSFVLKCRGGMPLDLFFKPREGPPKGGGGVLGDKKSVLFPAKNRAKKRFTRPSAISDLKKKPEFHRGQCIHLCGFRCRTLTRRRSTSLRMEYGRESEREPKIAKESNREL